MTSKLHAPDFMDAPDALLEQYIAATAARPEPIAIDSIEGKLLYRALAAHIWNCHQRPVVATDIKDLWERIDTIKRGSHVSYGLHEIHFWAADFANALATETVALDVNTIQRMAAWLDDWPNVCILGQTGRGKSSTINRLFGVKMAEISHHSACTKTVSDYRLVTGTFLNRPTGIVLWDAPGYGDERIPWDRFVKLYRRLARKCDVVVLMLDNERSMYLDLKMFVRLRKVVGLEKKLVVALNKADLFYPANWDEKAGAPSEQMRETIQHRVAMAAETLELPDSRAVVPISALKNWNIYSLLNAMVAAAGESKGARLLGAARPVEAADNRSEKAADSELGKRFGINPGMRRHFRRVLE